MLPAFYLTSHQPFWECLVPITSWGSWPPHKLEDDIGHVISCYGKWDANKWCHNI